MAAVLDHLKTNLHAVWDSGLIDQGLRRDLKLDTTVSDKERETWSQTLDPVGWATESYKLACDHAYVIPKDGRLGQDYLDLNFPVVNDRLKMAGVRLAALLNVIYDSKQKLPFEKPAARWMPKPIS